ncbi:Metallo-dependent phosphatase [Thozetella sp. PMI_491]|nr:Metallo-dependent phosphatase [Thozetella sp. PMI_491]
MLALALLAGLAWPAIVAASDPPSNSQIRLAYSGPTGMVVSWNTEAKLNSPTVLYGLSKDKLIYSASSKESVTYQSSLTYNNHVKLTGLLPDTTYYYMPSMGLSNESSPGPWTFKTAKPAGDMSPYTIAFTCDLGTMGADGLTTSSGKGVAAGGILKPGEKNTIDSLASSINTYDFVYADYFLKEQLQGFLPNISVSEGYKVYERILNEFYDDMERITATRPYLVGPGNHEANCDNGGTGGYTADICVPGQTNFTGYINHFRMPSDVSGGLGNFWYSFDYGSVHYVFFDTETDLGHGLLGPDEPPSTENSGPFGLLNQQIDWITKDLAGVDRCKTPWVIALGHRPWFSSGSVCANCSTAFAPLFEKYNVDMVLQGHFHVYERNFPTFQNGTKDPKGYNNPDTPFYVINGIAGHYDGMDSFTQPLKSYQAFGLDINNETYGWSRLHFYNQTHLRHEFVASNNDSVIDSVVLFKNHTICAAAPTSSSSTSKPTGSATPSSIGSVSLVTSTVRTTSLVTVTKCPATVKDCPAGSTVVVTSTIDLYTTVCPVTQAQTSVPVATGTSKVTTPGGAASSSRPVVTGSANATATTVPVRAAGSRVGGGVAALCITVLTALVLL